jgi:hypothetical protein
MPTFAGQISEESLIQLVAYIKSLQPEQNQSAGKAGTQTQNPNPGPSEKGR